MSVCTTSRPSLVLILLLLQQVASGWSRPVRVGGNLAGTDEPHWPKTGCPIQHITTLSNKRGMEEREAISRRLAGHWSVCGRWWLNFALIVWGFFPPFFFPFPSLLKLFLSQPSVYPTFSLAVLCKDCASVSVKIWLLAGVSPPQHIRFVGLRSRICFNKKI